MIIEPYWSPRDSRMDNLTQYTIDGAWGMWVFHLRSASSQEQQKDMRSAKKKHLAETLFDANLTVKEALRYFGPKAIPWQFQLAL